MCVPDVALCLCQVQLPVELMQRPYLRPVYDDPIFIVHTMWHRYAGWWNQNPAALKPPAHAAVGAELLALAGGHSAVLRRVTSLRQQGRRDVAAFLLEHVMAAEPEMMELQQAASELYAEMKVDQSCLMAKSIYLDASRRAATKAEKLRARL